MEIPKIVLFGLGGGVFLFVFFVLAGALDPLAFAAVVSYLTIYGFSLVLLRRPPRRDTGPPATKSGERTG